MLDFSKAIIVALPSAVNAHCPSQGEFVNACSGDDEGQDESKRTRNMTDQTVLSMK